MHPHRCKQVGCLQVGALNPRWKPPWRWPRAAPHRASPMPAEANPVPRKSRSSADCRIMLTFRDARLQGDAMITLNVNGKELTTEASADTPLLWVLRDSLNLTGTKFGCGMALCGACTVHIDGAATRSCVLPVSAAAGKKISTIENVAAEPVGKAVQEAWIAENVPQCGYCQSGQIMSATALLSQNRKPTDADIDTAMTGNICRCGTYVRIRAAIHRAAAALA